jgi:SAM-dependent methyltransferase
MNINTESYWDRRFATADWDQHGGRDQTRAFAAALLRYVRIPCNFSGTILDFGCGLGDAMPMYRRAYKRASLLGIDISRTAIERCKKAYGDIAQFIHGDESQVPNVDIIIASNVFEHLSHDIAVARNLLGRCRELYVVVPYRELIVPGGEHVCSYDEFYFQELGEYDYAVFHSTAWGPKGWNLWYGLYLRSFVQLLVRRQRAFGPRQILFHFRSRMIAGPSSNPA